MDNEVIDILKKTKAILADDHFVGTSGRHFATYINKDALYPHTGETSRIGELFATKYKNEDIDVVIGPALGGIILSTWVAYHLSKMKSIDILGIYTEKNAEKNQIFTRGYDQLIKNKKVLVVEDLTTTGGSVAKVVKSVKQVGGEVAGVCVMVNRDPKIVTNEAVGAPFSSLATLEIPSYTADECPLCKKNKPINTTVGHGKKFLEEKARQDK